LTAFCADTGLLGKSIRGFALAVFQTSIDER
jgi:hypothetical protein